MVAEGYLQTASRTARRESFQLAILSFQRCMTLADKAQKEGRRVGTAVAVVNNQIRNIVKKLERGWKAN